MKNKKVSHLLQKIFPKSKKFKFFFKKGLSCPFLKRFSSYFAIFFLVAFTVALRFLPISTGNFSFMYDNAKDSLLIRRIGVQHKPALYGAVTSIDGVYNGPLWYYLALPLNCLLNYHPMASILMVIVLAVLSVLILYFSLGFFEAFLYAISFGLIASQQSAWTPYMTPFVLLLILLIFLSFKSESKNKQSKFKKISSFSGLIKSKLLRLASPFRALKKFKYRSLCQACFEQQTLKLASIFLLTSFAFHFQTAYGMVLLPTVLILLFVLKIRPNSKQILISLLAFLIPFTPFFIFELRNDFHQSKAILHFIKDYKNQAQVINPNQKGLARWGEIAGYIYQSSWQALAPAEIPALGCLGVMGIFIYLLDRCLLRRSVDRFEGKIFAVFILSPLIFYQILPCKSYYLVALMPVWIIFFAKFIRAYFAKILPLLIILFTGVALINLSQSLDHYQLLAQTESFPFSAKLAAVKKVYQLSEGQKFSSYHFVPEVYDYTYQQIYLYLIDQDYPEPLEFSYAPGEFTYMRPQYLPLQPPKLQKQDSSQADDSMMAENIETSNLVFLIVEKYYSQEVFNQWWQRVSADLEILESSQINDAIRVYKARRVQINE
ncbi:MAG: hypothetical protein PVJ09_04185 [Candidatus Woesebacteria bacterium]|jgi:hypothetical protein